MGARRHLIIPPRSDEPKEHIRLPLEQLKASLDHQLLAELGWDPKRRVVAPPGSHPLLGRPGCNYKHGCSHPARRGTIAMCDSHYVAWQRDGAPDLEQWECTRALRGVDTRKRSPRALAIPCAVDVCVYPAERLRPVGTELVCNPHYAKYNLDRRKDLWWAADPETWLKETPPLRGNGQILIDLRRLTEDQVAEALFLLQSAVETQRSDILKGMVTLTNLQRETGRLLIDSGAEVWGHSSAGVYFVQWCIETLVHLATLGDDYYESNRWPMQRFHEKWKGAWVNFGGVPEHRAPGNIGTPAITQPWLMAAAKRWALRRLNNEQDPRDVVRGICWLSASLALRGDGGLKLAVLDHSDIEKFIRFMNDREALGEMTRKLLRDRLLHVRRFILEARDLWDGEMLCLEGLPPSFRIESTEIPNARRNAEEYDPEDDVGRSIPQQILKQILSAGNKARIPELLTSRKMAQRNSHLMTSDTFTNLLELQARVGRRTGEICSLPLKPVAWKEVKDRRTGELTTRPRLRIDMPKVGIVGFLLPIGDEEVRIIERQAALVRAAHPDTPEGKLKLFPQQRQNTDGTVPISTASAGVLLRTYVDALDLTLGLGPDGKPVAYDSKDVFWYAFRHGYAQRHADRGTPQSVLRRLMGHLHLSTTAGYYTITQLRMQEAVDKASPLTVDRNGSPVSLPGLDIAERNGLSLPVPLGRCTDDANVKADGQACPIMFQCPGCIKFETDPSFLPDLESYLTHLLVADKNLADEDFDAAPWVRNERPSKEHIDAVKQLILSLRDRLSTLPDSERTEFEEAAALLRANREGLMLLLPAAARMGVGVNKPTFFPSHIPVRPGAEPLASSADAQPLEPPADATIILASDEAVDELDDFEVGGLVP